MRGIHFIEMVVILPKQPMFLSSLQVRIQYYFAHSCIMRDGSFFHCFSCSLYFCIWFTNKFLYRETHDNKTIYRGKFPKVAHLRFSLNDSHKHPRDSRVTTDDLFYLCVKISNAVWEEKQFFFLSGMRTENRKSAV